MPALTGPQLIHQLHKLQIFLPVLAITDYSDVAVVVELTRLGCSDYMEKPFEAIELVMRVGDIMQKLAPMSASEPPPLPPF